MMSGHDSWMGFGSGYMWLIWLLILVVVIWAVRTGLDNRRGSTDDTAESALDILKKRYASGEISDEEFHRRRDELEK